MTNLADLTPVSGSSFLKIDSPNLPKVEEGNAYMINWQSLTSVNDLIVILAALGIAFPWNHPMIEDLKPFLDLSKPFPAIPTPSEKK